MTHTRDPFVLFDCWDTLIAFSAPDPAWETRPLYNHVTNKEVVSFEELSKFGTDFLKRYYLSHPIYEITAEQFYAYLCLRYQLKTDAPLSQIVTEILDSLAPEPVEGIESFLSFLEEKSISYAVLSNTIYPQKETEKLIKKLLPNRKFAFVLASGDVGVKKPNPDFFALGPAVAGRAKEDFIYVGDSFLQDVLGSYYAGYGLSVWLNWKDKKVADMSFAKNFYPDYLEAKYQEVKSYKELKKFVEEKILCLN